MPKIPLFESVPENFSFKFNDGKNAKNMHEFSKIISSLSESQFADYVNSHKNDFANWVQDVYGDKELASKLRKIQKDYLQKKIISEIRTSLIKSHILRVFKTKKKSM